MARLLAHAPVAAIVLAVALAAGAGVESLPAAQDASAIRAWIRQGRYADAELAAAGLLERAEDSSAGELAVALAEDVLVEALLPNGKAVRARPHAERALALKEKLLSPNDLETAVSLENLGRVLYLLDEWVKGGPLQERALAIRKESLGPEHALVAQSLFNLGEVKRRGMEWVEARKLHEAALAMRERTLGPDHPLVAEVLNSLGNLQFVDGDLEEAVRLHERALAIRERGLGPNHPDVALTLSNLGFAAKQRGDYRQAERIYERMLDIDTRALGADNPKIAFDLNNLGVLLGDRKDFARGISLVERALAIDEKAFGPRHSSVARDLDSLARLSQAAGDLPRAHECAMRALSIQESIFAPDTVALCTHLDTLASLLVVEGRLAEARHLYARSLAIYEADGGPNHFRDAGALFRLGSVLALEGDLRGARQRFERAASILDSIFGDDHPLLAEVLAALADLDLRERKSDAALANALHAESIAREHLRRTAQNLSEAEALRYESKRVSCLDIPLSLAARSPRNASATWDAVVRSRALLLDEMAMRHSQAMASTSKETRSLSQALATARGRYTQTLTRGPRGKAADATYREDLARANAEMERAERALAASNEEPVSRARATGLREVLSVLPAGSALLSYVQFEQREEGNNGSIRSYMALVHHKESPTLPAVRLGRAQAIEDLVARFRKEASTAPSDSESMRRFLAAGEDLRRAIWDPVVRSLGQATKVYVVPDGQLLLVNFAALPVGRGRFLVESGPELVYLSAERDLVKPPSHRSNRGSLLVLGGANFDADPEGAVTRAALQQPAAEPEDTVYRGPTSDCASFRTMKFVPIPASLAEVSEIASLWTKTGGKENKVRKLTGDQALEGSFKQLARGQEIIHLATHGFQVGDDCAGVHRTASSSGGENPLLLSGLALAGANRRQERGPDAEDGILTSEEVASLDLRGTDWVVLSACESGVGPIQRGEGVLGMRRAFQSAGARHLVMSLWPIPDQVARSVVGPLYEEHLSGRTTSEAMRRTAARSLEQRRRLGISTHPFFWGAFVATGADD